MKEWLSSILSRIGNGSLLPADYYAGLDRDAALDARDQEDAFVKAWTRLSEEIRRRWSVTAVKEELAAAAEDIRRQSFLTVSRATGQHEIASYVSDDLDLIVRGRLIGVDEPLIQALWQVYERGEFPRPPL